VDEPKRLGYHVLAEFQGCTEPCTLDFIDAASSAGLSILHSTSHVFSPQGLTACLILSESHATLHTWPEHHYAAVDIFCCGQGPEPTTKAMKFLNELQRMVGGHYFCRVMTPRGPF
jgi:S-adenosylmethionine decarboxylase proenzyme